MLDVASILVAVDQRAIVVPRPHPSLVTPRVLVMERLAGFSWDDVTGMKRAGINTEAVLRAAIVSFLEGAMLFGIFHGDLHGGNLFVQGDGRVALLDFGITGRMNEVQRHAFLRLIIGGTMNDVRGQVEALKVLGALAPDADTDQVILDLGLNEAPVDITTMSATELTSELKELTKALLGHGAKIPKELMLFVKNILFVDAAIGAFAPDIDLFGELTAIATYFATRYGERIAGEIGVDPRLQPVDLTGVRSSLGIGEDVERISYRELQARRETLREKFEQTRDQHGDD
jgi:ubiquinone biosynthesis protein